MKLNDQVTPLPWSKVIPVYLTLLAESINGYSIFAYVGYMVADLLPELKDDLRKLGYYAGLLGSSFYVGQFLSSFFWGKMSDKYGRRPILLIGTFGTMISTVIFGFSKYYSLAVTARFISGLLNGNIGVVKTYLGEVTDSTNQTRAFSYFSLTSGIASIMGAIAGGYLARPAVQYPDTFSATGLLGEFPYLLVNSLTGFCLLVALILTYFYLTENPRNNFTPLENIELGDNSLEMNTDTDGESDSIYSMKSLSKSFEEDDLIVSNYYNQQSWPKKIWNKTKKAIYDTFLKPTTDKDWSILRDHVASLACWIYALLGWIFIMLDEIFPVWSINKTEDGGLNFFTQDIGTVSAIGGVAIIIIQLFIYHRVANKLGLKNTLTFGLLVTIPTFFAFPFLNYIRSNTVLFWICMGLVYVIRNLCGQLTFTAIIQMINNSVYPEHMGATNGLGQSLVAFFRMIGPTIGGSLTSWSLQLEMGWHVNHFIPFLVLMILLFCLYVLTVAKLPARLNKPKQEQDLREALNELNFIQSSGELRDE